MSGWVKLYRKFRDWEWYRDGNTARVFIELLLTANIESKRVNGMVIQRGQVLTGRKKIAENLGLTEDQIRTAFMHLKSTNEITIKTTNKFSIITLCKFEDYQQKLTNESPTKSPTKSPTNPHNIRSKEEKEKKPPIIPQDEQLVLPENLDTPKFRTVWNDEWVPYRRERNIPAYKPRGLKAALTGLDRDAGGDVSTAIKIIRYSIEKNWQGLFPLKGNDAPKKTKHGTREKSEYDKTDEVTITLRK